MYEELLSLLNEKNWRLAVAESCTGGLVSAAITDIPGISQVYAGSITSYANEVKENLLKVPADVLATAGAVSEECAGAMAEGVAGAMNCQAAVSTTGIAGPTGAVPGKPVGTVCMGYYINGKVFTETNHFSGNRSEVRSAAVNRALTHLIELLEQL
ncbi:MAG: CinA family protein [Lentisphaeria bacterium]|nr:CinA family protein [Lentisphaerota bacterium]MBR7143467.1 CinA family protein [Lentisphaeria bacterium]